MEGSGVVEGKVYEIIPEVLPYLYRREGVNSGCYRPAIIEIIMDHHMVKEVLTFVVVNKEEESAPPSHYMEEVIRGCEGCVSDTYLKNIKIRFQSLLTY